MGIAFAPRQTNRQGLLIGRRVTPSDPPPRAALLHCRIVLDGHCVRGRRHTRLLEPKPLSGRKFLETKPTTYLVDKILIMLRFLIYRARTHAHTIVLFFAYLKECLVPKLKRGENLPVSLTQRPLIPRARRVTHRTRRRAQRYFTVGSYSMGIAFAPRQTNRQGLLIGRRVTPSDPPPRAALLHCRIVLDGHCVRGRRHTRLLEPKPLSGRKF